MQNQSGKIVLVLVLFLLLIGAAIYFFLPGFKKQENKEQIPNSSVQPSRSSAEASGSSNLTKDYYSKALKISFKVPINVKAEEEFINIRIIDPAGKISVTRNGTNYDNAKQYYEDLKEKNTLTPLSFSEYSNGKYNYVIVTDEDPNDKSKIKKSYFIYADYAVYIFSTSDKSLYLTLDQIVQSFEYKP